MAYTLDTALLLLRVVLGLLMAGHAMQKLTGAFSGEGFDRTVAIFDRVGFRPARTNVAVAIALELVAGALLVLGLITPFAAAALAGTLVVAASVHWKNGLWGSKNGIELPALLAAVAACVALAGPGRFALDQLIGLDPAAWLRWAATIAGPVAGLAFIAAKPLMARIGSDTVLASDPPATPRSSDV
ncbi:DoxX family protein [Cumulibacter manganitolerans]|uniref:DoxX family protein n=1 Tax=Cumulibacter manganitolerans TaxID=1884992 RepID=UPI001295216C|nr:DoxX family protein [Cumulibacter manganitolerans]